MRPPAAGSAAAAAAVVIVVGAEPAFLAVAASLARRTRWPNQHR